MPLDFKPMLAHDYHKHKAKIQFPCHAQPKIDGIRCIVKVQDGIAKLYSRTGKAINSLPKFCDYFIGTGILDGELHLKSGTFEELCSIVNRNTEHIDSNKVVYTVFDRSLSQTADIKACAYNKNVYLITCVPVFAEEDVLILHKIFVEEGHEGTMIRNFDKPYEHKRSFNLQKLKDFYEDEYEIVDVIEGKGKLTGCLGAVVCKGGFKVKLALPELTLKEYWERGGLIGKLLTVKYQNLTKQGKPRFPIGKIVRDYE